MNEPVYSKEKVLNRPSIGLTILVVNVLLILLSFALFIFGMAADIPGAFVQLSLLLEHSMVLSLGQSCLGGD